MRYIAVLILVLTLTLFLWGCSSDSDPAPPDDEPIDAVALIEGNCAQCHGLDTVYTRRDEDSWPAIVADMTGRASRNFSEEEVAAMTEYLQDNYGE